MDIWLQEVGAWLMGTGGTAYWAAPAVMVLVAILPIPAEVPAMWNGALFGPVLGTVVTWVGAMVGAQISFEVARRFGRPLVGRLFPDSFLDKADTLARRADWWGLLGARLLPLVAFTAINWGAGLTVVSRWNFFWTTAVGILPGAILFTASGSGLARILSVIPEMAGWIALGLIVGVGSIWWLRRRKSTTAEIT